MLSKPTRQAVFRWFNVLLECIISEWECFIFGVEESPPLLLFQTDVSAALNTAGI